MRPRGPRAAEKSRQALGVFQARGAPQPPLSACNRHCKVSAGVDVFDFATFQDVEALHVPAKAVMKEKSGQKTAIIVGMLVTECSITESKLIECCSGAGVGGVATAARLAKAGFKVTVFEKNDFTGGRCSLIHHDGYVSPPLLVLRSATDPTTSVSTKALLSSSSLTSFAKPSMIWIPPWKPKT